MEPNTPIPILGLSYIAEYLSLAQHAALLSAIDQAPWLNDLKRRVQHYGFKYDYKFRRIDLSMKIGELPAWALEIAKDLHEKQFFQELPDQLIVNEYLPGQGIAPHIDCEPCFEGTVASISLGSACVMDFTHAVRKKKFQSYWSPVAWSYCKGIAGIFGPMALRGVKQTYLKASLFCASAGFPSPSEKQYCKQLKQLLPPAAKSHPLPIPTLTLLSTQNNLICHLNHLTQPYGAP